MKRSECDSCRRCRHLFCETSSLSRLFPSTAIPIQYRTPLYVLKDRRTNTDSDGIKMEKIPDAVLCQDTGGFSIRVICCDLRIPASSDKIRGEHFECSFPRSTNRPDVRGSGDFPSHRGRHLRAPSVPSSVDPKRSSQDSRQHFCDPVQSASARRKPVVWILNSVHGVSRKSAP